MTAHTNPGPGLDAHSGAIAGVVGGGMALGIGELIAGLVDTAPSPVAAVGGAVVDWAPDFVTRWAISVFGTADKGALAIGTVIIALVAAWFTGRASVRRPMIGVAVFAGFALVGVLAGLREPLTTAAMVVVSVLVAAAAGLGTMFSLQAAGRGPESPTDGTGADPGRRRFLGAAAAGGAIAATGGIVGRSLLREPPPVPSVSAPAAASPAAPPGPEHAFGIDGITPIVVPNDRFYRIDTALVIPRVNADAWSVRVTGMVDRELDLTYENLLGRPLVEDYVTIACVSNEVGGDLVGNALWTGVPLVDILEEAGVQPEATQIVGRSVDGWTAGFPTEVAFDGRQPLLALLMNGEPLPARHGFPARLIVPGLYGYVSATKWLSEIELTTWEDFDGYWIPRGWSKEGPVKTQSRVDVPRSGARVPAGPTAFGGVAWAPTKGIERVELAVDDDGSVFRECEITTPLSSGAWVQWSTTVDLAPGTHRVSVRATDGTGTTQTDEIARPAPDGATGWHTIVVEAV